MVTGASALLIASIVLTFMYLGERSAGNTAEMLFRADTLWYAPLHISYSVGVDGISVAMLLLSAIIVFTGTFASWRLQPLTKEYFLWFTLLSMGVFGFFISIDLFTMFMFYEIALIPMYLLIGVWGSGRKEYAAMKLTLMLMGGIRNNREATFLLLSSLSSHYQLDTNSKYKISYIAEYGNAQGNKQLFHKRLFLPHMIIIERSTHDAEQGSNQPT